MVEEIEKLPKRVRLEWDALARRVLEAFTFPIYDTLIVGFSGGADSTALLYACAHLRDNWERLAKRFKGIPLRPRPHIIAAHFDHRLRPESGKDAELCEEVARKLGAEFVIERADVGEVISPGKGGVETVARLARTSFLKRVVLRSFGRGASDLKSSEGERALQMYDPVTGEVPKSPFYFIEDCEDDEKLSEIFPNPTVLLAHTMDDQAETVMMNLARGAGTRGAAGMGVSQEFVRADRSHSGWVPNGGWIVYLLRPFLGVRKTSLIELLEKTGISWLEDPTNLDPDYSPRNRIRNAVLPELEKCYPSAVEKIARFAGIVGETVAQLDAMADEFTERHKLPFSALFPGIFIPGEPLIEGALIRRSYLHYLPSPLRGQVFFKLLLSSGCRFSYQIMEEIDRLLTAPAGKLGPCGLETSKHYIWIKQPACEDNDPIFLGEPFGEELLDGKERQIEDSHVNALMRIITIEQGTIALGIDLGNSNQFSVIAPLEDARLPMRFAHVGKHKIHKDNPGKGRGELRRYYIDLGIPPSVVDRMKVLEDARGVLLWRPLPRKSPEKNDYPTILEDKMFVMVFTGSKCRFPDQEP